MRYACLILICLVVGCQTTSPLGWKERRAQTDIETALKQNSPAGWEWLSFHHGPRSVRLQENVAIPKCAPPDHVLVLDGGIVRINGSNINAIYQAVVSPDGAVKSVRFTTGIEDWREITLPDSAK
jgi:hypothetical protein